MKNRLTLLAIAVATSFPLVAQTPIALENASASIGDTVKICEKVTSTNYMQTVAGRPTYITLGTGNDQQIIIVIRGVLRRKFDYKPEKDLMDRTICVTGKLEDVEGKLQIVVKGQEDIDITK